MVELKLKLSDQVAAALGGPELAAREIMENAAVESYRVGRLSQREVGDMLGLDYWQTESFLAERGVPLNYSSTELDLDREDLASLITPT